ARYNLSLDEFRGLYISDEHVDALIARIACEKEENEAAQALTARAARLAELHRTWLQGSKLPWPILSQEFGLTELEQDILLLAIAPEVDLKYETLYAYLHNDVTRKVLSCDLACRLLGNTDMERLAVRRALLPEAILCGEGLLTPIGETRKTL